MRVYIRENLKTVLSITLLVMCTIIFICTNELVAKRLPELSALTVVDVDIPEGNVFVYTGKEIKPEIENIEFVDEDGNAVKKAKEEITILSYSDNQNVGCASIKVQVMGYQGSVVLKDAFRIRPAKVEGFQIARASRESIDLTWKQLEGVDGYILYKSINGGANYVPTMVFDDGKITSYQETNIRTNTTYLYYICGYANLDKDVLYGEDSEVISQLTPLATPVLTSVSGVSYNTIQLQWDAVDGAAGFQVFRCLKKDGEYECVAEITDGAATTYTDAERECGVEYYYYIKACQSLETGNVYGEPSEILGTKTTPNKVGLRGTTSDGDTKVSLSWKKSEGAQGYEIYRSEGDKSNYQLIADIDNADTLAWSESGLNKDTVYFYRIRPYCVVNDTRITGSYSGAYEKVVTIVFEYTGTTDDIWAITQYAGKVQYVWGGKSSRGWDCSGFTYWVYKNHFGIDIGTTASVQARKGTSISKNNRSEWKPGDLLFYTEGAGPSHVAIYLGNGQMIHALSDKYDTIVHDVDYYERWDRATSLISVKRIFN